MITTTSQFSKGSLYIPNAEGASGAYNAQSEGIKDFIESCERDVIVGALNADLYNEIKTAYETPDVGTGNLQQPEPLVYGVLPSEAAQWIKDLVNGLTYEYEGNSYMFKGLSDSEGLLPYYIFNKYLNNNYGTLGTDGIEISKSSSNQFLDPTPKDVETWNTFVDQYQGKSYYEHGTPVVRHYKGGTLLDYYRGNGKDGFVDLLTFLDHYEKLNEGTYTNLNGKLYERKNSFGI